jgi:hypothetical protein
MASGAELFSLIGFPARVAGRALLVSRYLASGVSAMRLTSNYGDRRFGKSLKWRPWLVIDVKGLEAIEDLINRGTDAQLEAWRISQLNVCGMIAIIGALVAQAGLTSLQQLPTLEDAHFVARGAFVMSLMLSYLSVFFSGLLQLSFSQAAEPRDLRVWLSSSVRWDETKKRAELESSLVAHQILQAPFEIISMSIILFVVGFGVYLGSIWAAGIRMSTGRQADRAVLISFIIPTVFVLLMYGYMLGIKDRELVKSADRGDVELISTDRNFSGGSTREKRQVGVVAEPSDREVGVSTEPSGRGTTGGSDGFRDLTTALKEAADAHRKCAIVDEELANQYESLLKSS